MFYKYRVTLEGKKGFFRVYAVNGINSLYHFHKQLRADLEFPQDQPILFKAMDANDGVVARYALIDIGFKAVDEVSIEDTVKAGVVKFVYFYDISSKKSVIITLEGQSDVKAALPTLLESKGPLPIEFENGYVAFEDLPEEKKKPPLTAEDLIFDRNSGPEDEDDEDEDAEDEDKEEEELIYDEKE
ncbi:MAG: hypothetical protein K6G39_05280 [Bacteroidales bacterium]|nr:hypothetical protein [Bacteroidales bacterium]